MRMRVKVEDDKARAWMRKRFERSVRQLPNGMGTFFRATTAQLKRVLRDPDVPKGIKCHAYQWLRYRRQSRA